MGPEAGSTHREADLLRRSHTVTILGTLHVLSYPSPNRLHFLPNDSSSLFESICQHFKKHGVSTILHIVISGLTVLLYVTEVGEAGKLVSSLVP